ncbi:MAG: UDP-N-acetylmuramate--L-alanine ligase [Candidatus Pacebacteria bacterium]|nr:UDP-N-acetylmuramate--L-alanine ligase [Candidatus Paceibacterota bacterium]
MSRAKHVHFIGIGGIGMSALARMLVHRGVTVSGSDSAQSELTKTLENEGMSITYQQVAENITGKIDFVVYTDAMAQDSEELTAAREAGITTMSYFETLGEVAKDYKVVAVAGTHGKTTTTAMTAQALIQAGLDPTVIVGSLMDFGDGIQTNFKAGKSRYLIVEACEYKRHFLHLHPHILAITNVELDHPDYYKDLADVEDAFAELASKSNMVLTERTMQNNLLSVPDLKVPGEYNKQNAALALAICDQLRNELKDDHAGVEIDMQVVKKALENFTGTWRRFEYKGKTQRGALVYDDYAHHPTAIKKMLKGAREKFGDAKIIAVFESHTYSRTGELMNDFAQSFNDADEIIITPIYAAREEKLEGVSAKILAEKISAYTKKVQNTDTLEDAVIQANKLAQDGDVIVFMGAGNIYRLVDSIIQK